MTYSSTGPLPASVNCAVLSFRHCIFYFKDVPSRGLAVTWLVRRPFYFLAICHNIQRIVSDFRSRGNTGQEEVEDTTYNW